MENHQVIITRHEPTEHEFFMQCSQCFKGVSNKEARYSLLFQRWNDASFAALLEANKTGDLTLAGQNSIHICLGCYNAIKKCFE